MDIEFSKGVIIKEHKNTGLLINTEQARYRKLNGSGYKIAKIIQKYKKISIEELLKELSDFYEIPKEMISNDLNAFLDELLKYEFIVNDSSEERQVNSHNNDVTGNGIWIKVTNRCNLKCQYCYAESGMDSNGSNELTINEIEDILKVANESYNKIIITGGEPLLRKDILDIIKVCKKYSKVQLLTNGTLGDKKLYENIVELTDYIQISIDSYEKEYHDKIRGVGSFEKAVSNARLISKIDNTKLAIAMTPTPEYKPDIVEMIKFCLDMGIYQLHINRFVPYGRAKKYGNIFDLKEFYEWIDKGYEYIYETYVSHYRQNRNFNFLLDVASDLRREVYSTTKKCSCGLNKNLLSIDCNGNVYLCPSLHKEDMILGNIRDESIDQIKSKSVSNYKSFHVDDLEICKNCDLKYFCSGGCRAIALNNTNNIYGVEDNCPIYKERILDLMVR